MIEFRTIPLEDGLEVLIDYRGKTPPKSNFGIPVISAKVVKYGRIVSPIEQKIDPAFYPIWMTRGFPAIGDVVMTTEGPLGEIAQLDEKTSRFALGQRVVCLRGKKGVLDNKFLKFLLMSPKQQEQLGSFSTGTTVSGISQKSLRSLLITIPYYDQQIAIGELLGALDDKIDLNRRMNATLEAMARAIFKDWFVDFGPTRAKTEGRPPYLAPELWELFPAALDDEDKPVGWETSTIGKEARCVGGATPSTGDPTLWNGCVHWVTPKDLSTLQSPILLSTERKISEAGLTKISSGLLPIGTVLLSSRAPIGYVAIAEVPTAINQGFIALICDGRLSTVFVWQWVMANMEPILQNANGSTFQEISKTNFRPLAVIVSDLPLLKAFENVVLPLYQRIRSNDLENRTLAQLRDLLLPKLMSGEIRLKDAEKAVEAVA